MKHVVTMKYWLINDGTFRCGVWMISIWLRSIIPYHFYSKATPTLGGLHSLRCHRLSYGLLCGWWSTGGAIFFDLELLSNVFLAMFSNKRDEFCVMCSLDPLDFSGDMKWRFHLPLIQKTRPYLLGGDAKLWSVASNSESHDQCQMHAFWATHFFLGFFLIYTGYKARNTCEKLGHCQLRWMWSFQQLLI